MLKRGNSMETNKKSSFSGRLGYVMAAAGSAVGLGNIWRFPYLAAKYGGGTFLFTYIILGNTIVTRHTLIACSIIIVLVVYNVFPFITWLCYVLFRDFNVGFYYLYVFQP